MIDDVTVRNLSAQTQASYVQYVSQLARYCQTSPEKLGVEDIRTFLLYLVNEKGLSPSARNVATHALRFLFLVTLRRSWTIESIPSVKGESRLPVILQPGGSPTIDRCCPTVHRSCDSQHDVRDRYLGRYTNRVAISNHRLKALHGGQVTFAYKDYKQPDRLKAITLSTIEFLRRLLLHVLPDGFQRLRYYGFIANRQRTVALALCRQLLNSPAPESPPESLSYPERLKQLTEKDILRCPICNLGQMVRIREFGRGAEPRIDSS